MNRKENRARPSRQEVAARTIARLKKFTEHLKSGKNLSDVYSLKKIVLEIELEPYTAKKVKEVRDLLKVSQALFAKFLNVSPSSVQKWERGAKSPAGAVCRLMDEIRCNPEYWRSRLAEMSRQVRTPVSAS